jgi:hypothetical protein
MSEADKLVHVTKLEAARRQLQTAIELWVEDRDPVSTHTLAFAAYQIIHDLNRHAKGPALLLDSPIVKPETRQEFVNRVKEAAVFFKHADDRGKGKKKKSTTTPTTSITLDPAMTESFFAYTIIGLEYLRFERTDYEVTFLLWYAVQHPEIINVEVLRRRTDLFSPGDLAHWQRLSKPAFFDHFLNLPAEALI